MTVPAWLQHYVNLPMPPYVEPLAYLGVVDDLTSPTRLNENGFRYIPPPSEQLGYFELSSARDPRPLIVHEGVPGHYFRCRLPGRTKMKFVDIIMIQVRTKASGFTRKK